MTDGINHGLNTVVTQGKRLLRSGQLVGKREHVFVPALGLHDDFHGRPLPGPGVADIHSHALHIVEAGDAGVSPGDDGEGFPVH